MSREWLEQAESTRTGRLVVPIGDGEKAELTVEPRIQKMVERVLKQHGTPMAAAVMISVADGRVLAMAGRTKDDPDKAAELCLTPWAPAASIFKLVTTAALLTAGVKPSERLCYHGGIHSFEASNLTDHPALDRDCNTLAWGLAKSQNAILGRLATRYLTTPSLSAMAHIFGFGEKLNADMQPVASSASIPSEPLPFARVAAGFWQTTLSPLHGAWIAATIARGGITPPLHIVARILGEAGASEAVAAPATHRAIDESTARTLAHMMIGTTEFGTAHRSFHDRDGRPALRGVSVAGKTGTLTRRDGSYLLYSWFVGFAPAKNPKVAVAVLLGNSQGRYVRAHLAAKDILYGYFHLPADARDLIATR